MKHSIRLAGMLAVLIFAPAVFAAGTKVNGTTIPESRFEALLKTALAAGNPDTPELRAALRTQLLTQETLRQAALKKGYDKHPAVLATRDDAMIRQYLAGEARPEPIAEQAVRARYDAIVASLGEKEFKASLIAVTAADAAREILAAVGKGADFAEQARRRSILPSAATGGALDWVSYPLPAQEGRTQGLPLPIATALATLPVGGISADPIVIDGRYYLLRLDEARPTRVPNYAEAAPALRQALEGQARERAAAALTARLLKEARLSP